MNTFSITTGIAILALFPLGAHAQTGVYDYIRSHTSWATLAPEAELALETFVQRALQEQLELQITQENIDMALRGEYADLCSQEPTESDEQPITYTECQEQIKQIRDVVEPEAWIRSFGREIQAIAARYDMLKTGSREDFITLITFITKTANLWQSGVDKMMNPLRQTQIRFADFSLIKLTDEEAYKAAMRKLEAALNALIEQDAQTQKQDSNNMQLLEKYIAAVWRYRYGLKGFAGTSDDMPDCNQGGDGTETELLMARWCDVEDALKDILDIVPQELDPPVAHNETVLFMGEQVSVSKAPAVLMPALWATQEDIGFMWELPLEPVLPSLINMNGQMIYGGTYPEAPPEPDEQEGICSNPLGARGFLCRRVEGDRCPFPQTQKDEEDSDAIFPRTFELISCGHPDQTLTIRETASGPDLCRIGGWRNPIGDDPDTAAEQRSLQPDECSNCIVDLFCDTGSACPGGETSMKEPSGRIPICINSERGPPIPATYVVIHELVHAQQICNLPPGVPLSQNTAKECCALEYEPYLISCKAMADDGNFEGMSVSVEECALAFSNVSCSGFGENACSVEPFEEKILMELNEIAVRNAAEVPASCNEALENPDPRIRSLKESLKLSCRPGCETSYDNTIGNNLCYIGQCIEESIEEHRIIPGRVPLTSQDTAFPWDACTGEDPQIASLVTASIVSRPRLSPYRIREAMQHMEQRVCEANGFPRLSPTILCRFDARRRLDLPIDGIAETGQNIVMQEQEHARASSNVIQSMGNIATRIGAAMAIETLRGPLNDLSGIIGTARKLIEQIGETPFTKTMCPRWHTDPYDTCNAFLWTDPAIPPA
ncbi:MAG: hypothetical protein WCX29_02315 [Candidatus Peribacteraceae bacterium]